MTATVNAFDVLNLVINEPRVGAWSTEVDVDSEEAFDGAVTITVDGVTWQGTAVRGDTHAGHTHAHVVGGAGKLNLVIDAKHYVNPTLYTVLSDIAGTVGESLSATCDPLLRSRAVPRYTRTRSTAGEALRELAQLAGMSWRILRDGSIWVGVTDWVVSTPTFDEIDKQPALGTMTIAPEQPTLEPGTTFEGKRVSRVVTRVTPGGLRQEVAFDDGDGEAEHSRGVSDIVAFIEACVGSRFDYSRMYACRVVKQAADGTLELLPDNAKVRGTGITRVPIRHGIPGVAVKVPAGGRVLLFFEDGDKTKPVAALWPDGSSVTELKITAPTVIIDGDLRVTGAVLADGVVTALAKLPNGSPNPAAVGLATHAHSSFGTPPTPGT